MTRMSVAVLACALLAATAQACCSGMTMNSLGLQLTESSEGYVDHVYTDATGHPTVCYGHLILPGETFSNPVPYSECVSLLQSNAVTVPLNGNQFSALVDFTFNLGCGSLQESTLLRVLNQGDYSDVPAQMNRWVYGGGSVLPGLVTRRANEGTLWNTPVDSATTEAAVTTTPAPESTNAQVVTEAYAASTTEEVIIVVQSQQSAGSGSSSALPTYGIVLITLGCVAAVAVIAMLIVTKTTWLSGAAKSTGALNTQLLSEDATVEMA